MHLGVLCFMVSPSPTNASWNSLRGLHNSQRMCSTVSNTQLWLLFSEGLQVPTCPGGTACSDMCHGTAMCSWAGTFFLTAQVRSRQRCLRTRRHCRADPPAASQTRASAGIPLCLGSVLVQIIVTSVFLFFLEQPKKKLN